MARRVGKRPWPLVLGVAFITVLATLGRAQTSPDDSVEYLTEQDFESRLQSSRSALVAFVAPWCGTCRATASELAHAQKVLESTTAWPVLVVQVDVSRSPSLADRFGAQRTPMLLLFPDTRILSPALQVPLTGNYLYKNIASTVRGALRFGSPAVAAVLRGPSDLSSLPQQEQSAGKIREGTLVGLFKSTDADGRLQHLFGMSCARRHQRSMAFAHGTPKLVGNRMWNWAGLNLAEAEDQTEEAIFYLPGSQDCVDGCANLVPRARFSMAAAGLPWRDQVQRFCAWVERQSLGRAAVLEPSRAAALDGTSEWLLMLFDPGRSGGGASTPFQIELHRLRRMVEAAVGSDARFHEVLPVIVPKGEDDIAAFGASFGVPLHDPTVTAKSGGLGPTSAACGAVSAANMDAADGQESGAQQVGTCTATPWAIVLFNTRTRQKFPVSDSSGWCPGDEVSLCQFVSSVLDGKRDPFFFSAEDPDAAWTCTNTTGNCTVAIAASADEAPGAMEVSGTTFELEVVLPIVERGSEVLTLLYAPWCAHSIRFLAVWREFVQAESGDASVLFAQMDASRNEHRSLPAVTELPVVLLGSGRKRSAVGAPGAIPASNVSTIDAVHFRRYDGSGSVTALREWFRRNSAVKLGGDAK